MLSNEQYLLTKLSEEGSEVAQIALKAQQFGMEEIQPGKDLSNRQRIHAELNDLIAVVHKLNAETNFGYEIPAWYAAPVQEKWAKINHYQAYSRVLGLVQ